MPESQETPLTEEITVDAEQRARTAGQPLYTNVSLQAPAYDMGWDRAREFFSSFYSERERALVEALTVAAEDLDKAANQFAGLIPNGQNQRRFAEKATRVRAALRSYRRDDGG